MTSRLEASRRVCQAFLLTVAAALLIAGSPIMAKAATYPWSSATRGGLWSSAANCNPNTGALIAGDIAARHDG